jgi:hypothetical protein
VFVECHTVTPGHPDGADLIVKTTFDLPVASRSSFERAAAAVPVFIKDTIGVIPATISPAVKYFDRGYLVVPGTRDAPAELCQVDYVPEDGNGCALVIGVFEYLQAGTVQQLDRGNLVVPAFTGKVSNIPPCRDKNTRTPEMAVFIKKDPGATFFIIILTVVCENKAPCQ